MTYKVQLVKGCWNNFYRVLWAVALSLAALYLRVDVDHDIPKSYEVQNNLCIIWVALEFFNAVAATKVQAQDLSDQIQWLKKIIEFL